MSEGADKTSRTTTISLIVSGIVSGLLVALQGVTLHQAGSVQETTERVGMKASAELQALQKLQETSNEELKSWAEIRSGLQAGIDRQTQRQTQLLEAVAANQREILRNADQNQKQLLAVLGLPKSTPTPTPTPSQ